jgi:RecB family endonuclease NucS
MEKFAKPLTYHEMTADPRLADWSALRKRFQGRVHSVPPDIWDHLLELLHVKRGEVERLRQRKRRRFSREHDIETALAGDLSVLDGWHLDLVRRQFVCRNGGRADLVCLDERSGRYVLIELKIGLAGRNAVAQLLSYVASVSKQLPSRRQPHGILCADRLDNEAAGMVDMNPALHFVSLRDLGLA